jgi:YidC/Oxa1 family membrane protein insertase
MVDFLGKVFGPLTAFMSGVLETVHSLGVPWWLSIVFLTVMVRSFLFPLTVRQVRNMRDMQSLRPEVEGIRIRYKDEPRKQQEAIMELYRERRVNPLAGFIPLLVQLPVFITMYHVVRDHEETFSSFASGGLLWFTNLTRPDAYFILPVLSATILVAAGEISARNVSPGQRRMMRFLPVVFTAFIARFPAGLFVYWVTSNTFTLAQNYLIYHRAAGSAPPATSEKHSASSGKYSEATASRAAAKGAAGGAKRKARKKRKKRR